MADVDPGAARDAASWAKNVSRLYVSRVPEGAINLNVEGRRLASPIQGFGKMWQKTYQTSLPLDVVTPTELVAAWKQRFPEFWPEGNRFYAPLTGIEPGDVALLNLAMPGRLTLSTGVMVLYSDEESFTLMTPQGHMFAGWITFSSTERDGCTVAQTQVLMRASDPVFELGLTLGGHAQEDRVLAADAAQRRGELRGARRRRGDPRGVRGPQAAVVALDQRAALRGDPVVGVDAGRAGARHPPAAAAGARGALIGSARTGCPGQAGPASQGSVRS